MVTMNRAQRRRRDRLYLHSLRDRGCTCTPTLTDVAQADYPEGVRAGVYVAHEQGCCLGDRVVTLNRLGVVPSMFYAPVGGDRD